MNGNMTEWLVKHRDTAAFLLVDHYCQVTTCVSRNACQGLEAALISGSSLERL